MVYPDNKIGYPVYFLKMYTKKKPDGGFFFAG